MSPLRKAIVILALGALVLVVWDALYEVDHVKYFQHRHVTQAQIDAHNARARADGPVAKPLDWNPFISSPPPGYESALGVMKDEIVVRSQMTLTPHGIT